ncbi:uncharacterized protein [Halyomorpha halys]|uniref:uncharacterized protein isoform X2 n=1 Tax=Halyomorpha halys TaxID=286706 RepID=UPI0006D4EC66|nr:uncharacterized protein LOC106690284 isoform X2 [Halyomorpha halys]
MKAAEPERLAETKSLRRHFTSPELIDHDYWNCRSVQSEDKENEAVPSAYDKKKNQITQGEMSILMVGQTTNEDPAFHRFFVCQFCGNIWNEMSQLMLHLESAHPSELEVDVESHTVYNLGISQLHSCLYCDFTTEAFEPLVEHIKSCHKIVNENCCPHCEYRTMLQASLRDHIFQKHRDSCLYCLLNMHA